MKRSRTFRIMALRPLDAADFEHAAERSCEIGGTHVLITEALPESVWQMEAADDPYPSWYLHQPGLLKIFPPERLKPFVDVEYAERTATILAERCAVLRRLGLKAYYCTNEPQVLPETFFRNYPQLRGPRVDHTNRSRHPHFAPCTDRPEVLELYRESLQRLLQRCPEVALFSFLTTDSGAGFCWAPALYPGRNGPAACKGRKMSERVGGFLRNLQSAGEEAGHQIEINIVEIPPRPWMLPTFEEPKTIAGVLPPGLSVNNHEGPHGQPFMSGTGLESLWSNPFHPVLGIPRPVAFLREHGRAETHTASRKVCSFTDSTQNDLNFRIMEAYDQAPPANRVEALALLRRVALGSGGHKQADGLLDVWLLLDEVETLLEPLDFGPVLRMGCILARWINRPFVPFPEELRPTETAYWRPFLFQAKGDEAALNLVDIQAMRMFAGWGARMLVEQTIEQILRRLDEAIARAQALEQESLSLRLRALRCLLLSTRHAVAYQAQLDRVKGAGAPVDHNPVLGTRGSWDREDLLSIARGEIDNCIELKSLLERGERLIETANRVEEENIMHLSPDLPSQLGHKVNIMSDHWRDYDRLFTEPNP